MNSVDNKNIGEMKQRTNVVVGHQIMVLRKSRGLIGQDLANKLGLSQQQISRYERGVSKISIDDLILLLNYLDFSLENFF